LTDAELWGAWGLWMGVASAVIVVAASLLVAILVTAKGILTEAVRALGAADRIREATIPIWGLKTTNEVADELLDTVRTIERDSAALARTLEAHAGSGGVRT
jgi:hypothetical protein